MALVVSFADLARTAGVARSTITRAFASGGPMQAALIDRGTADASHPAVVRWLAERAGVTPVLVDEPGSAITVEEAARWKGCTVAEVKAAMAPGGPLAAAVLPAHEVTAVVFSVLSGSPLVHVLEAARAGSLLPAVTDDGRINLAHPRALAYCAAHPFRRRENGEIDESHIPDGMLFPAMVGDQVNPDSPFARVFVARCVGGTPTAEDLAEFAAGFA